MGFWVEPLWAQQLDYNSSSNFNKHTCPRQGCELLYSVSQNKRPRSQLCFLSLPPSINSRNRKYNLIENNET